MPYNTIKGTSRVSRGGHPMGLRNAMKPREAAAPAKAKQRRQVKPPSGTHNIRQSTPRAGPSTSQPQPGKQSLKRRSSMESLSALSELTALPDEDDGSTKTEIVRKEKPSGVHQAPTNSAVTPFDTRPTKRLRTILASDAGPSSTSGVQDRVKAWREACPASFTPKPLSRIETVSMLDATAPAITEVPRKALAALQDATMASIASAATDASMRTLSTMREVSMASVVTAMTGDVSMASVATATATDVTMRTLKHQRESSLVPTEIMEVDAA